MYDTKGSTYGRVQCDYQTAYLQKENVNAFHSNNRFHILIGQNYFLYQLMYSLRDNIFSTKGNLTSMI
jgi:hypothetical protein